MLFSPLGVIRTNTVLDRESQSFYWLTVVAEDRAIVARSSIVEVLIEVEDVNDNTPQTTEPVYYPSVHENSPSGASVLSLYVSIARQGCTLTFIIIIVLEK